jgi:biotin operon repressor
MNKFQKQTLKSRLIKLAKLKCTGPPAVLATSLEISERSIKRFVKELRDEGVDIRYCHTRRSYVTSEEFV